MKNILICILLLTTLVSCHKKTKNNAVIIKDCTGSYISKNNTDYFICNDEIVANIKNGTEVSVTYKNVESCNEPDDAICLMLHLSEGFVEIIKINKK